MDNPATTIILSNVPPFLSNEVIQQNLGDYGTVVCRIIMVPWHTRNDQLKHIESFRRFCFVVLKDGVTQLNIYLSVKVAEHDYRIFAMTETFTCYSCGAYGHTKYLLLVVHP